MTEILKVDVPETELLDVEQMMKFASDGFVRLDRVVPEGLNREVLGELDAYEGNGFKYWDTSLPIRKVFQLPQLCGALRSLMGPDPIYNHSFVHIVPAHHPQAQDWHADSIIDTRPLTFDVLVMYFPQDTPREMGAHACTARVAPARHPVRFDRALSQHRRPATPGLLGRHRVHYALGYLALCTAQLNRPPALHVQNAAATGRREGTAGVVQHGGVR